MDVSALVARDADLEDAEEAAPARAPSTAGVYGTLREHAQALVELTDQVAEDAQADGGLHDKQAELLAVILVQVRGVADLIEILADLEETADTAEDVGAGDLDAAPLVEDE